MKNRKHGKTEPQIDCQDFLDSFIVYEIDLSGNVKFASRAALDLFGYSQEDIDRGINLSQLFVPEDLNRGWETMQAMINGENLYGGEYEIIAKDGTRHSVLSYPQVVRENGRPVALRGILVQVTAEKRVANLLRQEHRRAQSFLDIAGTLIMCLDRDGTITLLNAKGTRILGIDEQEAQGMNWFDHFIPPDQIKNARTFFSRLLNGDIEPAQRLENIPVQDIHGNRLIMNWDTALLRMGDGTVIGTLCSGEDITERHRLETELRESEARYRAIFREARDGIALCDCETGYFAAANPEYERIVGYTEEELLTKHIWDTREESEQEEAKKAFLNHIQEFPRHFIESELYRRDGTHLPTELSFSKIEINGKLYFQSIVRDISLRRKAQQALRESEEKYRSLHDTMLEGVLYRDQNFNIISMNKTAEEIFGQTTEEARDLNFEDDPHPPLQQDGTPFKAEELPLASCFRTGKPVNDKIIGVYNPQKKEYRWLSVHAVPQFHPGEDTPYQAFMTFSDITESQRDHEALLESEEKFSTAFHAIPDPVIVSRLEDGMILDVNDSLIKHSGRRREDVIGHRTTDIGIWPDSEKRLERIKLFDFRNTISQQEHVLMWQQNTPRTYLVSTASVSIKGEQCLLSVMHDVTDQKQAEQTIRDSEEKFSTAFHASPNIMVISRLSDGYVVDINNTLLQTAGYTRDDVIGHRITDLDIWVNKADRTTMLEKVRRQSHVTDEVYQFRWKNGEIHTYRFSATPIFISGERHLLSVLTDITLQLQTEQALRDSEEKFSKAFFSSPNAVTISTIGDEKGIILEANDTACRYSGYSREELIGRSASTLGIWNPHDAERIRKLLKDEGHIDNEEFRVRVRSGDYRIWLISAEPITFAGKDCILSVQTDITERKRAEEALRESEERFSVAFHASPDSMAISDDKGICLEVNDGFVRDTGYNREEVLGRPLADIARWVDEENRKEVFRKFRQQGYVAAEECQFYRKIGEIQTVLFTLRSITLGGKPCRISVGTDITERKRTERELERRTRFIDTILDNLPIGIGVSNTEHKNVYTNAALGAIYEMNVEQFETVYQMIEAINPDPDYRQEVSSRIRQAIRSHDVSHMEWDNIAVTTGKGNNKIVSVKSIPLREQGLVVSCVQDITERFTAEKALRESEERFSVAFHASPSMMILTSIDDSTYIEVNDSFCRHTGYTRKELIGKDAWKVSMWAYEEEAQNMLEILRENEGSMRHREYHMKMKNGDIRTWLCSADIITIQGKPCLLAVANDITERKEAEAQLKLMYDKEAALRQQLEEEIKRRAEFTRALVHELKTPLTPIVASSEGLSYLINEEPARSMIENVNRGAHNLNKRIDELLELARSELNILRIEPSLIDLTPLLQEIGSEMSSVAADHQLTLNLDVGDTLPLVNADAGRIRQVVENLLTNALKFTPAGGEVELKTHATTRKVIVEVKDTGPGLSPQEKDRIFLAYYRKEKDREHLSGLGLGLALCKTLVDLHGGEIWVRSRRGQGSTFGFSLPLVRHQ